MKILNITNSIQIKKHNTSTFTIGLSTKSHDSEKIIVEQKITRKFDDITLTIKPFFESNPQYAKIFFSYIHELSKDHYNEQLQQSAIPIIQKGMELLDQYLEEHGNYEKLRIPKGKIDTTKGDLVDKDRSILLIKYSWYLKLYMFIKNTSLKLYKNIDVEIMKIISQDIINAELDKKILNIIKGKIISTIHTRQEMWNYLEYSVRKSPETYISQLYNYTMLYILLFMKQSYNPIGFLGDFINRQIIYIFTDVYVTEITYHNFEDYNIKSHNLLQQTIANDIFKLLYDECNLLYDNTAIFLRDFNPSKFLTKLFIMPVFKKIIIADYNFGITNITQNLKILYLYISFLLRAFLKLKYIPMLLTSNIIQSAKKVNSNNAIVTRKLSNIILDMGDLDLKQEIKQTIATLNQYMYFNVINKKLSEFDGLQFLDEFKIFIEFINDENKIQYVRDILVERAFNLKAEQHELKAR